MSGWHEYLASEIQVNGKRRKFKTLVLRELSQKEKLENDWDSVSSVEGRQTLLIVYIY